MMDVILAGFGTGSSLVSELGFPENNIMSHKKSLAVRLTFEK